MSILQRPRRSRKTPPVVALAEADASTWPAWTDNWFWSPGECPAGMSDHITACIPESDETNEEWMARLEDQEAEEKARVLRQYEPLAEDLAEYAAWSAALEAGCLPPAVADHFRLGEYDAIRRGQISADELGQLVAHGCI